MFEKMRNSRLMYWSLEALIVVLLIICLSQLSFILKPIATFFSTLLVPILAAGFLSYLLNPIIRLLERVHIKRGWAVLIVLLSVLLIIVLSLLTFVPSIVSQVGDLFAQIPSFIREGRDWFSNLSQYRWYQTLGIDKILASLNFDPAKTFTGIFGGVSNGIGGVISSVAGILLNLITIPVLLIYMLLDGHKFVPAVQRLMPERYRDEVENVFAKMNDTLSHYISGQAIECLCNGVFTFIGYSIIGVPYAYALGFVTAITTLIPYIGAYIGIFPALVVALTIGWQKVILVIIVTVIVQMVDSNLVFPNVMGRSLDIHPMTIIILLLVAGNIWGLLGTILSVPVYAVVKTLVIYAHELYTFHMNEQALAATLAPKDAPEDNEKKDGLL